MSFSRTQTNIYFSSGVTTSIGGASGSPWIVPSYAQVLDTTYTIAQQPLGFSDKSLYLLMTQPAIGVISRPFDITGITVTIYRYASNNGLGRRVTDETVQLYVGGNLQGNNKATSTVWPIIIGAPASYGGSGDTWGLTLNNENVKSDGSFGVALRVNMDGTSGTVEAYVDVIRLSFVYYTFKGIFVP